MKDHWLNKVVDILNADTSNLRELALMAGGDPQTFYRGVDVRRLDLAGQDVSGMEFGSRAEFEPRPQVVDATNLVLADLGRPSRYEERLAKLILLLSHDREAGLVVLEKYQGDRSEHATEVLAELRQWFASDDRAKSASTTEIARFVRSLFSHSMPTSRAAILYYMVKHLVNEPGMRAFLTKWWSRSSSYALAVYQRDIEDTLEIPRREWLGGWFLRDPIDP